MKRKRYETLCGVTSFIGFMFAVGSIGGMELETITLKQGTLQSLIGLAVFAGAAYIGGFMDEDQIYRAGRASGQRPAAVCKHKRQNNYQDARKNSAL